MNSIMSKGQDRTSDQKAKHNSTDAESVPCMARDFSARADFHSRLSYHVSYSPCVQLHAPTSSPMLNVQNWQPYHCLDMGKYCAHQ